MEEQGKVRCWLVLIAVCATGGFILGCAFGCYISERRMQVELIEKHIAEYNPVTGEWQYKEEFRTND